MELAEIFGGGAGILVAVLTLFQISPIKINPWSWIARHLGKAINEDITEKVNKLDARMGELEKKIDAEHASMDEYKARQSRTKILRFGDEIRGGQLHTKEHFDDILSDIDMYEIFCEAHKGFKNGISEQTIKYIKKVYDKRLEKNDFL